MSCRFHSRLIGHCRMHGSWPVDRERSGSGHVPSLRIWPKCRNATDSAEQMRRAISYAGSALGSAALRMLLDDLARLFEGVVAGRRAAIDRLLQDDLLDVVGREAAVGKRGAHMQLELVPLTERHHGADHQHATGTLVVVRTRPDLAPDVARDHLLEFAVEWGLAGVLLV